MRAPGVLSSAGVLALALAVALPGAASGQDLPLDGVEAPAGTERGPLPPLQKPAKLLLRTEGDSDRTVHVGDNVKLTARLRPFVPGQKVKLRYSKGGKVLKQRTKTVRRVGGSNVGSAEMTTRSIIRPAHYRAAAVKEATPKQEGDKARAPRFHPTYPDLDPGQSSRDVRLFNQLLHRKDYFVSTTSGYGPPTERAVMAFRKVNNMARGYNATPEIFRLLADDKGGYQLARPGMGRHVEVDISRQVMVLADHGRPQHIFHVSTGAPSTPTIRGTYRFYRRQPGFNSVGMYYSVYFQGGYAIHGYHSVPPYNASHGCVRNPIPNSRFIYDWVRIGMPITIYE